MTTHPIDSSSRARFLRLSALFSGLRARSVSGTLLAFLALTGSVMAQITPTRTQVVERSKDNYTWTYGATIGAPGTVTANVPSGACGGGTSGSICKGTFFTIYDFTGYIAGSAIVPPGWKLSVQLTGHTPSSQRPSDNSKLQNLTFYYTGPDIPGPAGLGDFSVGSSFGTSTSGLFSYQALKNGSGADSGSGAVEVPVAREKTIDACNAGSTPINTGVKCAPPPPPPSCALTLVKSADLMIYSAPGTTITYSYLVKNTGGANLMITVTDPHVNLSPISCPSSVLDVSNSETCTATYTTVQADLDAGSISNTGTVTGTGQCSARAVSSLTIPASGAPALNLVKSASATSYSVPETTITYSYLVTNSGNQDLTNVSVADPQVGLSAVSCPSGTLAQSASQTCTAIYTTTQADVDAGSISNTGTASGTPPTGPAVTAASSLTIPAIDTPSVSLVKTASAVSYSSPGIPITYSYLVTNTGNVDLTSVSVTDPQPNLSAVGCPNSSLAPGVSETCTAAYTTTQVDVDAGSIVNTATASGTPSTGGVVTDTSSLTIPASDAPAIRVVKSASVANYSAPGISIT